MRFWIVAALLTGIAIASAVYLRTRQTGPTATIATRESHVGCRMVNRDYVQHRTGVWVTLHAKVLRLLPDATGRYRHQRFIVRCRNGRTVLVVNDVSIGTRVPISVGGAVGVRGEYVWNTLGGLIHFTHHSDTGGPAGWILWRSRVYSLPDAGWTKLRTKTWITE